ncbi:MAG: hypothetical protein WC943_00810 [Elusimicrobiota bacterium]
MLHADADQPATKGDLRALRAELDQKIDTSVHRLALEIVKTQSDLYEVKETLAGLATKEDINRILGAIDSFAGKSQNYDRATTLHGQSLTEMKVQVTDHEGRIKKLESGQA